MESGCSLFQVEKQNAEDLQLALVCNKQKYKHALSNLEQMSEEVHARRKSKLALPPRTPGVGAETESEMSDLPSSHFGKFSVVLIFTFIAVKYCHYDFNF